MPKKITFLDPVGMMSGKFAPTNVKPRAFQNGRWIGAKMLTATMYAPNGTPRCTWQMRSRQRQKPYTATEFGQMQKFGAVSTAVKNVMRNPTLLNTAQTEFKAQSTYLTLRSYVWHREWDNYQG